MFEILDFTACADQVEKISLAYKQFRSDMIERALFLKDIEIIPKTMALTNGYEEPFWHIISRKTTRHERKFDEDRACRIAWIRPIIENYNKPFIKMFYYMENDGKIRLYLWLFEYNFLVILERIRTRLDYAFIVTSFYIDNEHKKSKLERKFQDYINKVNINLNDCEWF